jgi:hypothetical protein
MLLCHRGCGLEATFTNYLGEPCCSPRAPSCPVVKKKVGERSGAARKGKPLSDSQREKLRLALIGRECKPETKEKIKQSNIDHWANTPRTPWNKGKKGEQVAWNKGHRKQESLDIIGRDDPVYSNFRKYRNRVAVRTRKTYQLYKEEINPNNLFIGKCGIDGANQIDHIISVREGFEKGMSIEEISSKENLQILPWLENIKKYDGSRKNK